MLFPERAAKLVEQQERERALQQQQQQAAASPRAGTPVGSLMGVVPPPSSMGLLNQAMPGNAKSALNPLPETIKMQHPGTLQNFHHLLTPSVNQVILISNLSLNSYPHQNPI